MLFHGRTVRKVFKNFNFTFKFHNDENHARLSIIKRCQWSYNMNIFLQGCVNKTDYNKNLMVFLLKKIIWNDGDFTTWMCFYKVLIKIHRQPNFTDKLQNYKNCLMPEWFTFLKKKLFILFYCRLFYSISFSVYSSGLIWFDFILLNCFLIIYYYYYYDCVCQSL